jgi:colanic acid/amylovoran biosynthesis protein
MKKTKVLITNVYSYKNKGDAAITLALIREIKRVFNNSEITIQTTDIKTDKGKYGVPVSSTLLWILLSSARKEFILKRTLKLTSGIFRLIPYLYLSKTYKKNFDLILSSPFRKFVQQILNSDLVIASGGGYLRTETAGVQDTILLMVTCLNFLSAKYLGKPTYLYSQSIGPVHGRLQHQILKLSLNSVDYIELREETSLNYLKGLRIKTPKIVTAEPAFLLARLGKKPILPSVDKVSGMRVGITVRKWFKNDKMLGSYVNAIAQTVDYLAEQHGANIYYIPQVTARNFDDDDRKIALMVKNDVVNKEKFHVIEDDIPPMKLIRLCGSMDIFIGTRMHSNIFALVNKIPVVAIEYEHKTGGIMSALGLEDLVIDINEVDFKSLRNKVATLLRKRGIYINKIEKNLPIQIGKSKSAIEFIKEHYINHAAQVVVTRSRSKVTLAVTKVISTFIKL